MCIVLNLIRSSCCPIKRSHLTRKHFFMEHGLTISYLSAESSQNQQANSICSVGCGQQWNWSYVHADNHHFLNNINRSSNDMTAHIFFHPLCGMSFFLSFVSDFTRIKIHNCVLFFTLNVRYNYVGQFRRNPWNQT